MSEAYKLNSIDGAGRALSNGFLAGLTYCRKHDIDDEYIRTAIDKLIVFLQELNKPTYEEPESASPKLAVVWPATVQLRFEFDPQPTKEKRA